MKRLNLTMELLASRECLLRKQSGCCRHQETLRRQAQFGPGDSVLAQANGKA
jgi:hypothetical protein